MSDTPFLSVRNLAVSYDEDPVLFDVNFDVTAGRMVGIIGPNGAGKSTLLKAILDLVARDRGEVEVFGRTLRDVRKRVVYVPQRGAVDWDFPVTVADVVLMGRYGHLGLLGRPSAKDRRIARDCLEQMGISDLAGRQIAELSGGQQQRTFLARALAQQGDLLFMDEPFVGVDAATEAAIVTLLQGLGDEGKSAVVVNHDLQSARSYFDDMLLLNGRQVAFGPTGDVFTRDNLVSTYGGRLAILDEGPSEDGHGPAIVAG